VKDFFNTYYVPNNASLCVAGDIDVEKTKALVEQWFGEIPAGKPVQQQERTIPVLAGEKRLTIEDRVQLPRLYMAWISPAMFSPGDAELDLLSSILAGGKNSRLYKRLVYDMQIAQDVSAFQESQRVTSEFQIVATPRAGHTLAELESVIQEEVARIKTEPPTARERGHNSSRRSYKIYPVQCAVPILFHSNTGSMQGYVYPVEPDRYASHRFIFPVGRTLSLSNGRNHC
jgi:zinc protease